MVDVNNVSINGNNKQNKALLPTIENVKRFADPEDIKNLKDAGIFFDKTKTIREVGETEKKDGKYIIRISPNFDRDIRNADEKGAILAHELAHISFQKKHNSLMDSKQEELYAFSQEEKFKQKFWQDRNVSYKPLSEKQIMEKLNNAPEYRCLPDTSPETKSAAFKAKMATGICQIKKGTQDYINNFLKFGAAKDNPSK